MTTKTKSEILPATTAAKPLTAFERDMAEYTPQILAVLPAHISLQRFERVVITAVNSNPELAKADRRSLFNACVKSAQDGLLPDGREAALVIFNTKVKGPDGKDHWEKRVQYMPMVAGIRIRMRNSGEVKSAVAEVIHENDEFHHEKGDNPHIIHKPILEDPGKPIGAYAIIKLTNGEVLREVMNLADIEKARAVSKMGDSGPWKTWFDEMARKTILRRCAKAAPMQSDLDTVFKRDDDLEPDAEPRDITPDRPRIGDFKPPAAPTFSAALLDADGEEFEFNETGDYVEAFCRMLVVAATNGRDALTDAWEVNSPQLHKLRDIGRDDLAKYIHGEFVRLEAETKKKPATKTAESDSKSEPDDTEPPAPPTDLAVPKNASGKANWPAYDKAVRAALADKPKAWIIEWRSLNARHLDWYADQSTNQATALNDWMEEMADAPEGEFTEADMLGAG